MIGHGGSGFFGLGMLAPQSKMKVRSGTRRRSLGPKVTETIRDLARLQNRVPTVGGGSG